MFYFYVFYCQYYFILIYKLQMKRAFALFCVLSLWVLVHNDAILNNLPVTFSMTGSTTYIPDAGGSQQTGYKLTLGFVGQTWLGVKFANSGGNSDFLVLQISDFYTSNEIALNTGHQVSYLDYNLPSTISSSLSTDTITTNDISSYAYSLTKSYSLQITRYAGSNNGQDWDGNANKYSLQQVCFYTSDSSFDPSTFDQSYAACYFYEINNFVSTFVGLYLKSFVLNGYNTTITGYIDGPILTSKVYFYHQVPLLAYVTPPAAIIEIGGTAGNFGQDYYVSSPISSQNGDYYGQSISQMAFDNDAGGFQNPALVINHWNADSNAQISGLGFTALRLLFSRQVYTYDSYDKSMLSTFLFCIYLYSSGSINGAQSDKSCELVELSTVYVQMGLASSSQKSIYVILMMTLVIMICLF